VQTKDDGKHAILCVVDRDGKIIKECKAATEPEAIHRALEGYADRLHRAGLEAQSFSPWLSKELWDCR